ncbi:hypothetical protein FJY84_02570 [Candidatus Bathyarchaeota archaeon]|nr:hypothetical protein [Candidatus Bathyarchaeota archaeon]
MKENEYREYLTKRGLNFNIINNAINEVEKFEKHLIDIGKNFDSAALDDLKKYLLFLIEQGKNNPDNLLALARYFWLVKRNDFYSYFTKIVGNRDIYRSISDRLEKISGKKIREEVFQGLNEPPLGSPPESYPACTAELLKKLYNTVEPKVAQTVLTGNHHRIPESSFNEKKKRWEAANSIDEFLKGEYLMLVKELEDVMKSGRLWYEQEITPEVVEYVRADPTIQNGIRDGNKIIKSKIAYDPVKWLHETDPKMKRFYMCHCPLARNSILDGTSDNLKELCYCSAGYEKLPWDIILGEPVEVEVLESVLAGNDRCRFAITIPPHKIK